MVEIRQSTLPEIIETENRLVLSARERYGAYYTHAESATAFFSFFIASVPPNHPIFARFWSLAKKHHFLALLSTARLHKVQAMMDLRQSLEASVCAAFAIAHNDPALFADTKNGVLDSSKALASKRYRWLDANFPEESNNIKEHKDRINASTSHANIVYTQQIFEQCEQEFKLPFFDIEDSYYTRSDLYTIGATAISLMNLLYGVNVRNGNPLHFVERFKARLIALNADIEALQREMLAEPRAVAVANRAAQPTHRLLP